MFRVRKMVWGAADVYTANVNRRKKRRRRGTRCQSATTANLRGEERDREGEVETKLLVVLACDWPDHRGALLLVLRESGGFERRMQPRAERGGVRPLWWRGMRRGRGPDSCQVQSGRVEPQCD